MVTRRFADALLIGAHDPALIVALRARISSLTIIELGVESDATPAHDGEKLSISGTAETKAETTTETKAETKAETTPNSEATSKAFDLIIWPGGLESVNDVPGVLASLRAHLQPDGLLVGALIGDGSFAGLRRLLTSEGLRAIARMHPQISLKTMGDLMQHIGFALAVVDVESLEIRYGSWRTIVADLRAGGLAGQFAQAPAPFKRAELLAIENAFQNMTDRDGKIAETIRIIHFLGWAPHSGQPRPARRGSGQASLAEALRPGEHKHRRT